MKFLFILGALTCLNAGMCAMILGKVTGYAQPTPNIFGPTTVDVSGMFGNNKNMNFMSLPYISGANNAYVNAANGVSGLANIPDIPTILKQIKDATRNIDKRFINTLINGFNSISESTLNSIAHDYKLQFPITRKDAINTLTHMLKAHPERLHFHTTLIIIRDLILGNIGNFLRNFQ